MTSLFFDSSLTHVNEHARARMVDNFEYDEKNSAIIARSLAKTSGKTGVEMEAIMAVSTALITIYDMCKAIDRWMEITDIKLLEKAGGKSGHVIRTEGK